MARKLTENNDRFYGYKRKPNKTKGNIAGVDLDFESVNPYEFKKGMYTELEKMGTTLRESEADQREKATETVLKNLKDVPAYYSYMEHYETATRNMDRKPSFKSFLKELGEHSYKEISEKFTEDKMKEIKLKESIRAEVRALIRENFGLKEEVPSDSAQRDIDTNTRYLDKINNVAEFEGLLRGIIDHALNTRRVTGVTNPQAVKRILLAIISDIMATKEPVQEIEDDVKLQGDAELISNLISQKVNNKVEYFSVLDTMLDLGGTISGTDNRRILQYVVNSLKSKINQDT